MPLWTALSWDPVIVSRQGSSKLLVVVFSRLLQKNRYFKHDPSIQGLLRMEFPAVDKRTPAMLLGFGSAPSLPPRGCFPNGMVTLWTVGLKSTHTLSVFRQDPAYQSAFHLAPVGPEGHRHAISWGEDDPELTVGSCWGRGCFMIHLSSWGS